MKNILMNLFFLSLVSCSFFKSDYDEIMGPIKKIKEEEKRLGKPNPIYDGVREPDFPDEVENNKTFDGVDSNHDGIRDDIEIWINRIGEDREVRISLKEFFKNRKRLISVVSDNYNDDIVKNILRLDFNLLSCAALTLEPFTEKPTVKLNGNTIYERVKILELIFFNTRERNQFLSKFNYSELPDFGPMPADGSFIKDCSSQNNIEYLKKLKEKY